MGRRRYRRARQRRTLAIIFVVLLVCLGVLVAVAVNALPFERPAGSRVPVLLPDSQ
jgi:uncharacterized membrane protein SirB2